MPAPEPRKPARSLATILLIALPIILFLLSFLLGRYPVEPAHRHQGHRRAIPADRAGLAAGGRLRGARCPAAARLAAMVVGGGLAIAGACYQGVFRNPLVSPFTLGVSAGAGFGAAVAILLFGERYATQACAFAFGLLAVAMCFAMNRFFRLNSTIALVLGGIIVGSLFTALLSLLKYVADPNSKLPVIEFWLLGSLSSVSTADLVPVLVVTIPCVARAARLALAAQRAGDGRRAGPHHGRRGRPGCGW